MLNQKAIYIVCALAVSSAFAQQEVNINSMPVDLQKDPNIVRVEEDKVASPAQGVVILNSQTASGNSQASSVLQQPTTYVQASPLTDSRADQMRQARQAAEVNTEQKIVEKLEASRLEDEKERADRLFGDRWAKPAPVQEQPVVQQVPVYVATETPKDTVEVVNVDSNKEDLKAVKDEIIEAVKEVQAEKIALKEIHEEKKKKDLFYVGGVLGMAEYNADNVENNGAGGFTVGTFMENGVIVEGSFLYSNYYLDQWWKDYDFFKEVDQYNFGLAVKYSPLSSNIKPYVGTHVGYTYRKYKDRSADVVYGNSGYRRSSTYNQYPEDNEVTSSAVDMGFLVGMDFFVSGNFAIGAEYKYTMNMFNKSDSDFITRGDWRAPENSKPLEEVDYSVFGISGKFAF